MLLPGQCATQVRRRAAELIVRWLGGDLAIIPEVIANRGLQEELAVDAPDHPLRAFGEIAEAAPVQQALQQALPHLLEKVTDKLFGKIEERFAALERRRPGPYTIAGPGNNKLLTIPQYLAEKERQHPEFVAVRKSFAPNFSVLVSVLKHDAARRSAGRPAAQGKRGTTEKDRPVLEHAWELAQGFRESLAAARERPSVIEMLRGAM